ncbi:TetR/AcrR family transcriptional regulator [Streptosporangium sp. NPDC048047]|uniref:TetR/AcrR family transcriptional regulator n=1 Tax=Streptosporangium sp. NPDC048047 TaxID=3155748 RepID=UPI00343E6B73
MTGVPSRAKRQAILDAATAAFLRHGYAASVDDIAAAAGVGKQTVYRHFGDKQALFLAALAAARVAGGSPPKAVPEETGDPAKDLSRIGEQILSVALSPTVAALHRLTVAEVANHPELNGHWGDTAAPQLDENLAGYLRRCHAAGVLDVPDPARTARQFAYLLMTEGRVASGYGTKPLTAERRRTIAAETADLVVRAHRPAG